MKHVILALSLIGQLWAGAASAQDAPPKKPNGYLFITGWFKDTDVQREYTRAIGPILKAHNLEAFKIGMEGANLRLLEGGWNPGRIMLLKFPTDAQVKSFWWSSEYQEAKKIRDGASVLDVVEIDGVAGSTPIMNDKSAYLVFLGDVKDMKKLATDYGPYAPDVVKSFGGQFIVRAGRAAMSLLEGAYPTGSVIVVEFPDTKSLRAFWNSDAYRKLSEVRKTTGKWSVVEITQDVKPTPAGSR
jgi:uncharacterized protein (DUF1330 family)